jgi:hypothetical protein
MLPFSFTNLGRWWGNDPRKKEEAEIDIVAVENISSPENGAAIFGECTWTNEMVDADVLATLESRAKLFVFKEKCLYLFSKNGFTKVCKEKADELDTILVSYSDM